MTEESADNSPEVDIQIESTVVAPRLLVIPPIEGVPTITWPGPRGQPGWAVPVTIPDGTQGYAIFLPVVPAGQAPESDAPKDGQENARPSASAVDGGTSSVPSRPPGDAEASGDARPAEPRPDAESQATPPQQPPIPQPGLAQPAFAQPMTPPPGMPQPPFIQPGGVPGQPWPIGMPRPYQPVPPPPGLLKRYWPGPAPATNWVTPAAVLAAALGIASFVPLTRTGVGWFLGWLVATVAVAAAVRRAVAELPRADRWIRAGWAVAALALFAVPGVRNAWWLVTFCVLGALWCAALAIVGGRRIRSILFSVVAVPFAAFRGLPWVSRHIRGRGKPGIVGLFGSLAATLLVLLIFGTLLSSADAAFARWLGALVPDIGTVFRWLFLLPAGGLLAVAAIYTITAPPDLSAVEKPARRRLGLVEWAAPVGALTLLFAGFVVVQFTVLFGGKDHVLKTAGLTYAQYARSGFWQLLAVTVLTLGVVAAVSRWADQTRVVDRVMLRALLGALCALSIVIVLSALSRMHTYQQAYGFTGARIFVMAVELLFGAIFLLVLVAGLLRRGEWVPRAAVGLTVVMLVSLAVLNPDGYAARRNIARFEETSKIDIWYVRGLSADATPALVTLPDPLRRCALSWIATELAEPDPWYAWNLGRARARAVLAELGPDAVGDIDDCEAAERFDSRRPRR